MVAKRNEINVKMQLLEERLLSTCSHLKEHMEETIIERDKLSERLSQVE